MSARQPIEPQDIRKGDLIRAEWDGPRLGLVSAEFVGHRDGYSLYPHAPSHYLLDRPTPAVELPTEPTLGWLTWRDDDAVCATTELGEWAASVPASHVRSRETGVPNTMVTAFTPATAVPTEALDALRHQRDTRNLTAGDIDKFLAAVDGAK